MTTVTVRTTWLPVATAEVPAAAPKLPTACRATAQYMAWSSSASSTGRAKRSRDDKIGPRVKSCSRSIFPPYAEQAKKPDRIPGVTRHLIRLYNCGCKPSDERHLI